MFPMKPSESNSISTSPIQYSHPGSPRQYLFSKKECRNITSSIPAIGAFRPLTLPGNFPAFRLATLARGLIVRIAEVFFPIPPGIVPLFRAEQGRARAEVDTEAGVTVRKLDAGNFTVNILRRCHFLPLPLNITHRVTASISFMQIRLPE